MCDFSLRHFDLVSGYKDYFEETGDMDTSSYLSQIIRSADAVYDEDTHITPDSRIVQYKEKDNMLILRTGMGTVFRLIKCEKHVYADMRDNAILGRMRKFQFKYSDIKYFTLAVYLILQEIHDYELVTADNCASVWTFANPNYIKTYNETLQLDQDHPDDPQLSVIITLVLDFFNATDVLHGQTPD
jgi:hypothetical protein